MTLLEITIDSIFALLSGITISADDIVTSLFVVFVLKIIIGIFANPAILEEPPENDRKGEVVETRSSRAMGLFAIVLVVITFILNNPNKVQNEALAPTLLSAGFLVVVFMLETHGTISKFWYRLQEDSLHYSGLLLFTSLYFLVHSLDISTTLQYSVYVFICLAWIIWIRLEISYLLIALSKWDGEEKGRIKYIIGFVVSLILRLIPGISR